MATNITEYLGMNCGEGQYGSDDDNGSSVACVLNGTSALNMGGNVPRSSMPSVPEFGHLKYLTIVFYLATFLFGAAGNMLVIYIILYYKDVRRKSVANYYILNLAFADILFIMTLPLFCHATYTQKWIFGNPTCKFMFVLKEMNKFSSIFTLTALSIDRYIACKQQWANLRSIKAGKIVCMVIWAASLVAAMPHWLYAHAEGRWSGTNFSYSCKINWPRGLVHREIWTYSEISIGLVIPFLFICISYVLLFKRIKSIMRVRQNTSLAKKPSRKMTRTICVVAITFLVCNLPYYVMEMVSLNKVKLRMEYIRRKEIYLPSDTEWTLFVHFNALAQILVFISSCVNPVIYGVLNENYRKYFQIT